MKWKVTSLTNTKLGGHFKEVGSETCEADEAVSSGREVAAPDHDWPRFYDGIVA